MLTKKLICLFSCGEETGVVVLKSYILKNDNGGSYLLRTWLCWNSCQALCATGFSSSAQQTPSIDIVTNSIL